MLMTQKLTPYAPASYHEKELKSLTRYRFNLVKDCSRLKVSFARLMNIIFPELEKIVHELQVNSVYRLMSKYTDTNAISKAHLTRLTNLLSKHSKGHYGRQKAIDIKEAARQSIGTCDGIQTIELQQTLARIFLLQEQTEVIEKRIKEIVENIDSPFITIPGISYITAAIIHAEIGDFSDFFNAEKTLAFAGMESSIYLGSIRLPTPEWLSEAQNTCVSHFIPPQKMLVTVTLNSVYSYRKNGQKENLIMLQFPTLRKNWSEFFTVWK
jgi:transposase